LERMIDSFQMTTKNDGDGEAIVGPRPSRRTFCAAAVGAFVPLLAKQRLPSPASEDLHLPEIDVAAIDRTRILRAAKRYLREAPVTITAFPAVRSAGGKHDYFSEGDYWWPDPANPSGPYIQRDGLSNPDNFIQHRHALLQLSVQMPALSAAWLITRTERYAAHAVRHLRAWFVDESTRINPHLEFAQAIHGRTTGRGIGIIDTLHLVEVARAAAVLEGSRSLANDVRDDVKAWFAAYLNWMTTSSHGIEEREAKTALPITFQATQPGTSIQPDNGTKAKTLNEDFDTYGRLRQRLGIPTRTGDGASDYLETPKDIAQAGEVQRWTIFNLTGDTHPMHFHLVNVVVRKREAWKFDPNTGGPVFPLSVIPGSARLPDANEKGWKETVRMNPGEAVTVDMKFDLPPGKPAPPSPRLLSKYGIQGAEYVWHCHILEHEEHDMMHVMAVI